MINHTHTAMMLELLLKWLTAKVRAVSHAHTHTDIHKNLDTAPELLSKRSTAQLKEASYTHNAGHNGGAAVKEVDSAAEGGKLHTPGHNAGATVEEVNSVAEGGQWAEGGEASELGQTVGKVLHAVPAHLRPPQPPTRPDAEVALLQVLKVLPHLLPALTQ